MEYIPYVIATSLFGTSFSYFVRYRSEDIESNELDELNVSKEIENNTDKIDNDKIDNDKIDNINNERKENSSCLDFEVINSSGNINKYNNNKYLGDTFKEKSAKIIMICQEECNLKMRVYSKKKHYNKLRKYIYEYEKNGHDSFVKNHYQERNA